MAKKTKILHIQGNPITIGFPVVQASAELRDGAISFATEAGVKYIIKT